MSTSGSSNSNIMPEERTFTMHSGIVIAAKLWRNPQNGHPRDRRRFIAFHGFLDNAASFDLLLLERLGPEPVEILALDLAGHGQSSHRGTEDYHRWRDADDVGQIADQMGWGTHAVIGHSMGGAVAVVYTGIWPERVTLCILLDSFGTWVSPASERPERLAKFVANKRAISTKRDVIYPSIEAAARAYARGSRWGIAQETAAVFITRSLRPIEEKNSEGGSVRGYTWSWDRMAKLYDPLLESEDYCLAFIGRIACPFLAILATNGFQRLHKGVAESRKPWLTACPSVTVRTIEGGHHFHVEDAQGAAGEISEWVQAQDEPVKARM